MKTIVKADTKQPQFLDRTKLQFVQAEKIEYGVARSKINLVVIHTTENGQGPNAAKAVAHYFQQPNAGGSAHYVVDANLIVHCVAENMVAEGARGVNQRAIHIEHCADAATTDWNSDYSTKELALSVQLAASVCHSYGIPAVWLTPNEVAAGKSGICGHIDVTKAFPNLKPKPTHTDPGDLFPRGHYTQAVADALKDGETGN